MSNLISENLINEIDISKVKSEQKVTVGIDAFPEKTIVRRSHFRLPTSGQSMAEQRCQSFWSQDKKSLGKTRIKTFMTTSNAIEAGIFKIHWCCHRLLFLKTTALKFVYLGKEKTSETDCLVRRREWKISFWLKRVKENDVVCYRNLKMPKDLKFKGQNIYTEIVKDKRIRKIKAEKEREEMLKKAPEPYVPTTGSNQAVIKVNQVK